MIKLSGLALLLFSAFSFAAAELPSPTKAEFCMNRLDKTKVTEDTEE
jgi:hypothetical protein